MNIHFYRRKHNTSLAYVIAVVAFSLAVNALAQPSASPKCGVGQSFVADPDWVVALNTPVTLTQTVSVTSPNVTTNALCGLEVDAPVAGGVRQQIQAVTLGDSGPGYPCADINNFYCSAGTEGAGCVTNEGCDTTLGSGDGICTRVKTQKVVENPPFGVLSFSPDTSVEGMFGFRAGYDGGSDYYSAPLVCQDLTVTEECSGAKITIQQASGPGEPVAPGGPYYWSFEVTVHACEAIQGVSAQGGANGWAQLYPRDASALYPSAGSAVIRKMNKKTDVILWTIGDMTAGQEETLEVKLSGSIKSAPDCQEKFLSGEWSALFNTDGFAFEKSDYTGRVSVIVNSNSVPGDCLLF